MSTAPTANSIPSSEASEMNTKLRIYKQVIIYTRILEVYGRRDKLLPPNRSSHRGTSYRHTLECYSTLVAVM